MLKINQSAFIRDLINEESIKYYNLINISMKISNFINIKEADNYKKADLEIY